MNKKSKEILEDVVRRADAMIEKLSVWVDEAKDIKATSLAQLAESEKPKLRHGDYGFDEDGEALLIHKQSSQEHPITSRDKKGCPCGRIMEDGTHSTRRIARLGNIFDDLAALKPIKEFEMKDCTGGNDFKARINCNCTDGHVELRAGCGLVTVNDREFHEIILKLRCMELRKIQDAAKQ